MLRILNAMPPTSVTAAGPVPYSRWGTGQSWTYDGDAMAVVITVRVRVCVNVHFAIESRRSRRN